MISFARILKGKNGIVQEETDQIWLITIPSSIRKEWTITADADFVCIVHRDCVASSYCVDWLIRSWWQILQMSYQKIMNQ